MCCPILTRLFTDARSGWRRCPLLCTFSSNARKVRQRRAEMRALRVWRCFLAAAVRVSALAAVVGTVSMLLTWRKGNRAAGKIPLADLSRVSDAGRASYAMIWVLLAISLFIVVVPFLGPLNFEKGPYLAMPLLLV